MLESTDDSTLRNDEIAAESLLETQEINETEKSKATTLIDQLKTDETPVTSSFEMLPEERRRTISERAKTKELPEKPAMTKTTSAKDESPGAVFDTKQLLYQKTTALTFADLTINNDTVQTEATNPIEEKDDSSVSTEYSSEISIKPWEVEIVDEPPPPPKKQPPAVPPNKPPFRTLSNCSISSVNSMVSSVDGWYRNTSKRIDIHRNLKLNFFDSTSSINSELLSPKPTDFTAGFSLPHPNIPAFQEHSSSVPNLFITEAKRETNDFEKNKCNNEKVSEEKSSETIRERSVTVSGGENLHSVQELVSEFEPKVEEKRTKSKSESRHIGTVNRFEE